MDEKCWAVWPKVNPPDPLGVTSALVLLNLNSTELGTDEAEVFPNVVLLVAVPNVRPLEELLPNGMLLVTVPNVRPLVALLED